MRIAFYLNLQGTGHCRRFEAIAKHLPASFELAAIGMDGPIEIRDIGRPVQKVSMSGWGPASTVPFVQQQHSHEYHDFMVNHGANTAFTYEMVSFLNRWRPGLLVSDVGLEASILARLCGIPTIYGRQHGDRQDKGHRLAYEWACSLLAPFSPEMEQENCPQWIREKTFYSGGFNRFAGREKAAIAPTAYSRQKPNILVMTGFGGTEITPQAIALAATATPQWNWHVLGVGMAQKTSDNLRYHGTIEDVWPYLCHADLVVANAGHNSTMEVAAAGVPSLCIPAPRPFDEQLCKARTLQRLGLCVVANQWPRPSAWPELMQQAIALDSNRWNRLQDAEAPIRAANHIAEIALKCVRPEQMQADLEQSNVLPAHVLPESKPVPTITTSVVRPR
ncbi:MAG: glycosyltransferase [Phormidesmis sp.]